MRKVAMGIYIRDDEYAKRLVRYIMNHYSKQIDVYEYTAKKSLEELQDRSIDILLYSGEEDGLVDIAIRPIVVLADLEEENTWQEEEGIHIVEKYQEVNKIIDEVLVHVSSEVRQVKGSGQIIPKTQILGVYSLSENDYQLPFTATLGTIISESKKVIVIDVQENSGLKQLLNAQCEKGLEELVVMIENDRFSQAIFTECIVHQGSLDYIYPVINTDSLCEINSSTYIKILQFISQEMDYDSIIINFGARFPGFYEVLNNCTEIFLIQKQGGLGQWREYEFVEDIKERGYKRILDKVIKIEPPIVTMPVDNCSKVIEQWKWTEFGDMLRGLSVEAVGVG